MRSIRGWYGTCLWVWLTLTRHMTLELAHDPPGHERLPLALMSERWDDRRSSSTSAVDKHMRCTRWLDPTLAAKGLDPCIFSQEDSGRELHQPQKFPWGTYHAKAMYINIVCIYICVCAHVCAFPSLSFQTSTTRRPAITANEHSKHTGAWRL